MKTILKVFNIGLFVGAIIHMGFIFKNNATVTFETSINMGIIPSIIIFLAVMFLVSFIFTNIKAKMAQEPFGNLSTLFYAGVALLFLGAAIIWFMAILRSAEQSYIEFVETFNFYIKALGTIAIYFAAMLGLSGYGLYKYRE